MLREPGSSGVNLQTKTEHRIRSITNAIVNAIVNRFEVKVFKHSGQLIYRIAFGVNSIRSERSTGLSTRFAIRS